MRLAGGTRYFRERDRIEATRFRPAEHAVAAAAALAEAALSLFFAGATTR
jgi:hypothetical protein